MINTLYGKVLNLTLSIGLMCVPVLSAARAIWAVWRSFSGQNTAKILQSRRGFTAGRA